MGADDVSNRTFSARYPVLGGGFFLAGRASGEIKRCLSELGLPAELLRRVVIATYEAEMNIVIHAYSGVIEVAVMDGKVSVQAIDRGPGIPDIPQAMVPGWSTASDKVRRLGFGAGMGLSNMERCSDELEIESEVNRGTTLQMEFRPHPAVKEEQTP